MNDSYPESFDILEQKIQCHSHASGVPKRQFNTNVNCKNCSAGGGGWKGGLPCKSDGGAHRTF